LTATGRLYPQFRAVYAGRVARPLCRVARRGLSRPEIFLRPMLSPDAETRMLIACYLHGDLSVHELRRRVMHLAWSLDGASFRDHPLTSKAIRYLHDCVLVHRTAADADRGT
jgi:hypothetical protein